jgi:hypothetical protein
MIVISLDGVVYQLPAEIVEYIQLLQLFQDRKIGNITNEEFALKYDLLTAKIQKLK